MRDEDDEDGKTRDVLLLASRRKNTIMVNHTWMTLLFIEVPPEIRNNAS